MEIIEMLLEKYQVSFSNESTKNFATLLKHQEYSKDDIILEQGHISRYMYIVQKGIIRQFYYKDGRDITEHFSCEGDIATCIESLFQKKPTTLSIEAIEDSNIYLLDYFKLRSMCDNNPEINELYKRIFEYKLIVSQQKADSWRFESSNERYERFCREYPSAAKRASIADIASYLLMAPETLSRVRAGVL